MYNIFVGIILFASFAMLVREGLWNNLIATLAILIAGITAFAVHQPLAVYADEQTGGGYTYLLDFPILWFTFAAVVGLLKAAAGAISKHRVVFNEKVDGNVGAVVGFVGAYLLTAFAMASFHTAPLSRDAMGGALDHGSTVKEVSQSLAEASALTRPDVAWLKLMQTVLAPERLGGAGFPAEIFVQQHTAHRGVFQTLDSTTVKR